MDSSDSDDSLDLDAAPVFSKAPPPPPPAAASSAPAGRPVGFLANGATDGSPDLAAKVKGANLEFLRRITERRRFESKVKDETAAADKAEAEAAASAAALEAMRAAKAVAEKAEAAREVQFDELGQTRGPESPEAPSIESKFGAEAREWAAAIVPVSRCSFGIPDPCEVQAVTTGLVQHWLGMSGREEEAAEGGGEVTPRLAWLRGSRRPRTLDHLALTVRDVAATGVRMDRLALDREMVGCIGRATSHPAPHAVTFPYIAPYDALSLYSLAHSSTLPLSLLLVSATLSARYSADTGGTGEM